MQSQFVADVPGISGGGTMTEQITGTLGATTFTGMATATRSSSTKEVNVSGIITNSGSNSAGQVQIMAALLGPGGTVTVLPVTLGMINPQSSSPFNLVFGNIPSGSRVMTLKITYLDGSPNGNVASVTIPVKVP